MGQLIPSDFRVQARIDLTHRYDERACYCGEKSCSGTIEGDTESDMGPLSDESQYYSPLTRRPTEIMRELLDRRKGWAQRPHGIFRIDGPPSQEAPKRRSDSMPVRMGEANGSSFLEFMFIAGRKLEYPHES